MDNVRVSLEGDTFTAYLTGAIDSANAYPIEAELTNARKDFEAHHAVIDLEHLERISSAGLRIILRIKKEIPDTRVINVCGDVYEVFELTGFTELMDIEKAFRVVSTEGCPVIGEGANGRVYRIDRDTIVKVYLGDQSLEDIRRERELARTAFVQGIPTAISYDVVRIRDGGFGAIYELLDTESLARLLARGKMTVDEAVRISVDLLRIVHDTVAKPGTLPDTRKDVLRWTEDVRPFLPRETADKLHALVEAVPESLYMLHGDYHVKNIMLQNSEALLIDMDTLSCGDPVFELGSMFNAYVGFGQMKTATLGTSTASFLGISWNMCHDIWQGTLRALFENASPEELREAEDKARIIGYTRLLRRCVRRGGTETEDGRIDIAYCREQLTGLIDKTETLSL